MTWWHDGAGIRDGRIDRHYDIVVGSQPDRVIGIRGGVYRPEESGVIYVSPREARVLAGFLLVHADHAEGGDPGVSGPYEISPKRGRPSARPMRRRR